MSESYLMPQGKASVRKGKEVLVPHPGATLGTLDEDQGYAPV
ncbi:hypothetical protein [Candidatus Thiosymbion oneisti]|nr:hypothetical protein [Candidatus Thiosymbion oneisti]